MLSITVYDFVVIDDSVIFMRGKIAVDSSQRIVRDKVVRRFLTHAGFIERSSNDWIRDGRSYSLREAWRLNLKEHAASAQK